MTTLDDDFKAIALHLEATKAVGSLIVATMEAMERSRDLLRQGKITLKDLTELSTEIAARATELTGQMTRRLNR